jgi:hypothetical protein
MKRLWRSIIEVRLAKPVLALKDDQVRLPVAEAPAVGCLDWAMNDRTYGWDERRAWLPAKALAALPP